MFVDQRCYPGHVETGTRARFGWRTVAGIVTSAVALAAAACSADITRFDQPSFALNDSTSSVTTIGAGSRRNSSAASYDDIIQSQPPSTPATAPGAAVAPLPMPDRSVAAAPRLPRVASAPVQTAAPTVPVAPRPVAHGEMVEVQQGDSLYGIAKRHHVSIAELMAANDLKNPTIKPGQKLTLPAAGKATAAARPQPLLQPAPAAPAVTRTAAIQPMVPAAAASMAEWGGSYTVKPGDSIYAIASHHGVKSEDLQQANGITDVRKIRPGAVLKVPGKATATEQAAAASPAPVVPIKAASRTTEPLALSTATAGRDLKIINSGPDTSAGTSAAATSSEGGQKQAAAEPAEPVGLAAARAATAAKLRWPVQGRIVQGFGPRADGSHNDGVDVAVPVGTDVLAAEAGTVAYAGSEVKTYGNLVLIRHDSGLVTAYAYNEQILVQRGDRVRRGQAIAKAGKTGNVDQPQLHFEVRVGTKPVDPLPYLEKL